MDILLAVLGGSALAALINQIGQIIMAKIKHKQSSESNENSELQALKKGMRYLMLDRISHIGQVYIKDGSITFDDRRILNEMHKIYHNDLGGNGDLDVLMEEVNELPLK